MNLVVTLEYRFVRTPDGKVWTKTTFAHAFWQRYLEVFESVRVIARAHKVKDINGDFKRVDGDLVSFVEAPFYVGPWQYLLKRKRVAWAVKNAVHPEDAVIMRVPSQLANALTPQLQRSRHPFGLEVVGDPYDVFAPGAVRHPMRPIFRWWFSRALRWQCAHAIGAAYVTEHALQRRYPLNADSLSFHYSNVEMTDKCFAGNNRSGILSTHYSDVEMKRESYKVESSPALRNERSFTLITVGSLEQLYKGTDVLIDAVARCVEDGFDLKLVIVGGGKHKSELAARAAARGLRDRACFAGELPAGEAIRKRLDEADLFVLASRTEGIPRAMIEAMGRGLPCIGTAVGGIPELLQTEDMVSPNDASALAQQISQVLTDSNRMIRMSKRNLAKAQEFREENLRERRIKFYNYIKYMTEEWRRTGFHSCIWADQVRGIRQKF